MTKQPTTTTVEPAKPDPTPPDPVEKLRQIVNHLSVQMEHNAPITQASLDILREVITALSTTATPTK